MIGRSYTCVSCKSPILFPQRPCPVCRHHKSSNATRLEHSGNQPQRRQGSETVQRLFGGKGISPKWTDRRKS